MTIRSDLSYLDHAYRAKRSAQSKAEYANAIQGYRAPTSWKTWALRITSLVVMLAAIYLGAR